MSEKQPIVDGSKTSSGPDYDALDIPTKNPDEYTYAERRAELLQTIREFGHPSLINQTQEAERYGVSQQQISSDLDRLAEYAEENLGSRRELTTEAVYHRAIRGLLERPVRRLLVGTTIGTFQPSLGDPDRDVIAGVSERVERHAPPLA